MAKKKSAKKVAKTIHAKKAKSAKSAKTARTEPAKTAAVTLKATAATQKTLKQWVAELSGSIGPASAFLDATDAAKSVSFAKDNANVIVSITTAGQSGLVPCTLNLPVGIFPLHYNATGVGNFNVTVTGAQLSHPIAGTAPDAGTLLIKVS